MVKRAVLTALLSLAAIANAHGETVTVTIVADVVDFGGARTIDDLPGPDGEVSFSEAILAADNTVGHDTIEFAIPLASGQTVARFTSITGYYWRAFDSVTIDGTTQTEFGGDTNPDGREVVALQWTVSVSGDDSAVLGFHDTDFYLSGANGLLEGNTGDRNYDLGSGCTVRGNTGSTLKITGSNNVVVGNTFDRVRVWGGTSNQIGGPAPEDRNVFRGYGYVNSEGLPAGAAVELASTSNILVENNWIGTADGLTQGNLACTMGIKFTGTNTGAVIRNNLISGILGRGQGPHHAGQLFGWAIYMEGTADDIEVAGNTVGLDIDDEPTLGAVTGVSLGTWATQSLTDIRIGGPGPGEGNIIAGQFWDGIVVDDDIQEVRIVGNEIWGNGRLGIDLLPLGVSPNDLLDADGGGNGLQNFPELNTAVSDGLAIQVSGVLRSTPSTPFTVEFFASPECDAGGFGEGQVYLGATGVTTDGSGDAVLDVVLPAIVDVEWVVTSTATREPIGATSEFSACAPIEPGTLVSIPDDDGSGPAAWALNSMPNPFRSSTTMRFTRPSPGDVRLLIFDASGRLIRELIDGTLPAGRHDVVWDGRDDDGRLAAGGIYFYQLRSGGEHLTRQVTLIR